MHFSCNWIIFSIAFNFVDSYVWLEVCTLDHSMPSVLIKTGQGLSETITDGTQFKLQQPGHLI